MNGHGWQDWPDWQDWHMYLALWCALCAAVALIGYVRSLAGVTRPQRMVRTTGRIERVTEPRHGGSAQDGIPVVVTFRDPATGQEHTVTNDRDHGDTVTEAWTGRQFHLRYPPGRPHDYRFQIRFVGVEPEKEWGLGVPNFAVFLIYAAAVTAAAIEWAWPWALVATCGPLALIIAANLPGTVRNIDRRVERKTAMAAVPGRVVAVLKDISTDGEGTPYTTWTPVVTFTTQDGKDVTAYGKEIPDPETSRGRDLTIHYTPTDPADFVAGPLVPARHRTLDITLSVLSLLVTAAAAVTGAILLKT
ncbi:DUF3592 domain-containing protein [Streptomyces sp. NPDC048290]|uniref:DUF3592 domain-containing protein n=1 Tax=Streptomyces sp. NPDC048290 TaxID=3155811 RepID=UPI003421BB84